MTWWIDSFVQSIKQLWNLSKIKKEKGVLLLGRRQTDDTEFGQWNVTKWSISGDHKRKVKVDNDVTVLGPV